MKNIIALLSVLFVVNMQLAAQSVAINTDGSAPGISAILDITSNSKGLLIPRMTTAQRTGIASPAKGLLVFDTDVNSFWFHNGTAWTNLSAAGTAGWLLTGNSGTNAVNNFMGTTDLQPLRFRVNNGWAGEIQPSSGNIFLGLGAGRVNTSGNLNAALGSAALANNSIGNNNVAIGDSSLYSQNGSATNVAVGTHSLYKNINGSANTAIGPYALSNNTVGGFNTAVGVNTLANNISGDSNTAIGARALQFTTGSRNTATGASALRFNTGSNNTAFGFEALYSNSGSANTANGYFSLHSNTNGDYNVADGSYALYSNTVGASNTAIGVNALYANTSAGQNTAIGFAALGSQNYDNGSAWISGNVAVGYRALYFNQPISIYTGIYNTAVGHSALSANTNGGYNTAIGQNSLVNNKTGSRNTATGDNALYNNISGNYNIAIGDDALYYNVGGDDNIAIGGASGTDPSTPSINNTISIGNLGYLNAASNQAFLGNWFTLWNGGNKTWSTYSDARMKINIKDDVKGLDFILRLHPVTYYRSVKAALKITGNKYSKEFPEKYDVEKIKETGFLAQEVAQSAKDAGYDFSGVSIPKKENELYTLSYEQFVVPLVKAMQEQQSFINKLQQQVNLLEKRLAEMAAKK